MKVLIAVLVLVSSVFSAPDISLTGYQYQVPPTSYGVPIGSVGNLNNNNRQYYHAEGHGSQPTAPSTVIQTPIHEYSTFRGGSTGPEQTVSGVSSFNRFQGPSQTVSRFGTEQRSQGVSAFSAGTTEVQRHIYFYAAPEEPEEVRSRVNIPVAPAKKNVRIIFIKAPTYAAQAPIQIPVQPQNEEKTLVYVLVKKPEEQAEINIPTPAPTKPSKPEVYFIKYKTQQEAQEAISNVQSGTDGTVSVSANSVEGDQDFINTIGQDEKKYNFDERIANIGGSTGDDSGTAHIGSGTHITGGVSSLDNLNIGGRVSTGGTGSTGGIHQLYGPPN